MLHCHNCKLNVTGHTKRCPLCQTALMAGDTNVSELTEEEIKKEAGEKAFPIIQSVMKQNKKIVQALAFGSIYIAVVCIAINLFTPFLGPWSLYFVINLATIWISAFISIRTLDNIAKRDFFRTCYLTVFAVLWDWIFGFYGWSLDFVFPILCTTAMATILISALVTHMKAADFVYYLFLDSLLSLLSIAFMATGLIDFVYPSVIFVAISIVTIAGIFIFSGQPFLSEIKRRLHL